MGEVSGENQNKSNQNFLKKKNNINWNDPGSFLTEIIALKKKKKTTDFGIN